jgi:zinc protease
VPLAPQLKSRAVYIVDKAGSAQSQIRIGWVGVPRSTSDYAALEVLNTILGGSFTSRLNQNLREEHGYSYGASSAFDMRLSAGPFLAAAGVQTDKTGPAVAEFFNELTAILKPIPADELAKAKRYLQLGLPGEFETTGQIAGEYLSLIAYGIPLDFYATAVQRFGAVTQADVERVARQYVDPDRLTIVIVGDRKLIEPGLRALNPGRIVLRDVGDVLGTTVTP